MGSNKKARVVLQFNEMDFGTGVLWKSFASDHAVCLNWL